jgi:hypothetical protein
MPAGGTFQAECLAAMTPWFPIAMASVRAVRYRVMMEPRGIYRERNGEGNQPSAHVKYDEHQELDVPEDRYRARDYQPPFDKLPWKDEVANDA